MQGEMMYTFKTKPYQHQLDVFECSKNHDYWAFFMEMGTGKSKVVVDQIGYLWDKGALDTVLIIAPKGVFDNWVQQEIPRHLSDQVKHKIVRWQPNWTKGWVEEISNISVPNRRTKGVLSILVMNVEAFSTTKGASTAAKYLSLNPKNMVVVDESTTIKTKNAQRTKNIIKLGALAKYRRILTGSPITKSPLDLYTQCAFLSPKALGFTSYYAFQGRYAKVERRHGANKVYQHITGYRRLEELGDKLDGFSSRILKEECLTLPSKVYIRRNVELTTEQKRLYNEMKKLALAQFENGELATTTSVLTQIMRLQQIVCGFLTPDEGDPTPIKNNRIDSLMELIDEASGKIIIWAYWVKNIELIERELKKKYGSDSVASYQGSTLQEDRQDIIERFQDVNSPLRFFIGQPSTGGYGITLTAATTVIYYSNSYNLEHRLQSEDRAHRIGQKESVTYVDLVSPGTVDEKIIKALHDKRNIAQTVLGEELDQWLTE
jgi:SNF2 family DNA or RNA helicase